MRILLRLLAIAGLVLLPLQSQAAEEWEREYIACVQGQLTALGVAGVKVTGALNATTRARAEAQRSRFPKAFGLALMPKLSDVTAVGWCRELAAAQPDLRRFMPSANPPLVMGEGGANSLQTQLLATSFSRVQSFFRTRYGLSPASRVDVAGAASGQVLARLAIELQKQRGRSRARMTDSVTENCDNPSLKYGGQAYRNQLLLCWPVANSYGKAWYDKVYPVVSAIMAHEYMHHVQRELANDKVSGRGYRTQSKRGPAWMTEGTAELIEYRWRTEVLGRKAKSLNDLLAPAHEHPKTLASMHGWGTVGDASQYKVALFAAWLLAERNGDQSIMTYWRYIGQGRSWDSAFEAAFGESLRSFSSRFEILRHDSAQAKAYIAGY